VTNTSNARYSSVDTGGAPRDDGRPSQGGRTISTVTAVPALRRDGEDITDHDLVARVRTGDDRAFEALYTRYHRRIASYIQGMVHDHARAEDIAQDVFMSALRRMRETDRPIAFKPWIYEIAKNACIDQFRRARRAEEVSMDADEGLGSADYGRLVSSGPTPDVAVDHKQQIDHLCGAFGGLSETHHEILVMRELEGLSYREIGEKLGMTRPAVESTLFRARRRLTEEYDELVTGERCVRVQQIITGAGGSALGARDRRRVARHVSYCQPCLRHARVSGLDAGDLVHRPVRQKIAAFLPLPAFLKERWGGGEVNASFANWSAQASSVDPGLVSTWGKAAATAATIAIAGVGAGAATDQRGALRDGLGGVSLQSLTGGGNPGGSDGATDRLAGGDGSSGSSSSDRGSGARSGDNASARERAAARDGRTRTTATGPNASTGGAGGENAAAGGGAAAANGGGDGGGSGAAAGDGGGGGGAGEEAGILSRLEGGASAGGGSGQAPPTDGGQSSGAAGTVGGAVSQLPEVGVPSGEGAEAGASAPETPVGEVGEKVGEKSGEVVGGLIGE
jgi:RNA polymerase sigma factor (sigma-70 family)